MAVWGQHRPSDLQMSFCPCESVGLLAPPLRRSRQRLRKHELLSQQPVRSDWVPILQMLREIKPHALLPAPGTPRLHPRFPGSVPEPPRAHRCFCKAETQQSASQRLEGGRRAHLTPGLQRGTVGVGQCPSVLVYTARLGLGRERPQVTRSPLRSWARPLGGSVPGRRHLSEAPRLPDSWRTPSLGC